MTMLMKLCLRHERWRHKGSCPVWCTSACTGALLAAAPGCTSYLQSSAKISLVRLPVTKYCPSDRSLASMSCRWQDAGIGSQAAGVASW